MSLAKMKLKENLGKKPGISKLKTALISPYKYKCPVLEEADANKLGELLQAAIKSSNRRAQTFATDNNLHIGLQSSLRAINNGKTSLVLLSLSIKPHHLISLIARNAEVKDETVPVFVKPKLELFVNEIFGIRAIAIAFPRDSSALGVELSDWLESKQKPKKVKKAISVVQKPEMPLKSKQHVKLAKRKKPKAVRVEKEKKTEPVKEWSGDFISLSSDGIDQETNTLKLREEKQLLEGVLSKLEEKTLALGKKDKADLPKDDNVQKPIHPAADTLQTPQIPMDVSDDDDFLQEYVPMVLHKFKLNPNKKPKKKRKNKINKNK